MMPYRISIPPRAVLRRLAAVLLSAVLSTMVAACGGDDDPPRPGTPTAPDSPPSLRCAR